MFQLKSYQERSLDALREYFAECTKSDPDQAFYVCTRKHFGVGVPYRGVPEMQGLPYVCTRVPTGGGKTLIACHAVDIARRYLLHADNAAVLWLVPSNAILEQTLRAMKSRNHPYRQALEASLGSVNILEASDALYVTQATLDGGTTIIVSTMQAFRVDDTTGRRVYRSAGALKHHFDNATEPQMARMERDENGVLAYSLANLLRLRRPIVIVDEAHGARTELSFETLARFAPSCILEFTATPHTGEHASNVLYSVSAAELKSEAMIKLPIILESRPDWKDLLGDAIACRRRLEEIAKTEEQDTGEYLRPIMLLQAQPKSHRHDTLTVEVVKKSLLDDHKIPESQIAIATGDTNELDGIDILSRDCELRYVITIQALREGWDCPFAYVLCSVAEMRSSGAVEQILGRVLRQPGALKKKHADLNLAYAFAASKNFTDAANALTDSLIANGFERQDAKDFIQSSDSQPEMPGEFMGTYSAHMPEVPVKTSLPLDLKSKIEFDLETRRITFRGAMSETEREQIQSCFKTESGKACVEEVFLKSNGRVAFKLNSPSQQQRPFSIPLLAIKQGDLFEPFEETHFLERQWDIATADHTLLDVEYSGKRPDAAVVRIDVSDKGRLISNFVENLQTEMVEFLSDSAWTDVQLVHWLDANIPHPDITPDDCRAFILAVVRGLIKSRNLSLDYLVRDKFRLRIAIETKISFHRDEAHKQAFQYYLDPKCDTPVVVREEVSFTYDPEDYPYSARDTSSHVWSKHYYPIVGRFDSKEEFECARFIDSLDEVDFWVRNLERRPQQSFWLPTTTDRFYPDFVVRLKDGRRLVVEYKGQLLTQTPDALEKKALGELWELRSGGACLFTICTAPDYESIRRKINTH